MFKLFRRIVCCSVTAAIIFFAMALWNGGNGFRWFAEKSEGFISKGSERLAEKADEIKKSRDRTIAKIKKWGRSSAERTGNE